MSMSESEATLLLLGGDPWIRFDQWAAKAWEAATKAAEIAASNSQMSSDDTLDGRVMTLFHASQLAKEFAEMVNPLMAVAGLKPEDEGHHELVMVSPEMIAEILSDDDE